MFSGSNVRVAYGAADPDFVASVRGRSYERPAAFTAEYARLVRGLVAGRRVQSELLGLEMDAALPPCDFVGDIEVGVGALRSGMARKAAHSTDFMLSWLTPPTYIESTLIPAMTPSENGRRPELATYVAVVVERPGRDLRITAQYGLPHLRREHYVDMLRKAGVDADVRDPIGAAREMVDNGILVSGSPEEIIASLGKISATGVEEIVLNVTPTAITEGPVVALQDIEDIVAALETATWLKKVNDNGSYTRPARRSPFVRESCRRK